MTPKRLLILTAMVVLSPAMPCEAQRLTDSDRCVDKVFLREGLTLYGAVLGRSSDGSLTKAVEREWLKSKSKKLYGEVTASEGPHRRLAAGGVRPEESSRSSCEPAAAAVSARAVGES